MNLEHGHLKGCVCVCVECVYTSTHAAINSQLINLQTAVQSSWDCNAFRRLSSTGCHSSDEAVELFSLFFQLFHKTVDCKLRERLAFTTLQNSIF